MFPPDPQTFLEAFWRGQERRFALALHDDVLLFWEPDSPQFQSEPQEWVFAAEGLIPLSEGAMVNVGFLIKVFQAALYERKVGRMLCLDSDKYVLLCYRGVGSIMSAKTYGVREIAAFHFVGNDEVFTCRVSYWLEQLSEWAKEPESDFAFALDWRGQNDEVKAQCLTQLSRGDWDELRCVAHWIMALDGHDLCMDDDITPCTLIARIRCSNEQFSFWVGDEDYEFLTKRKALWNEWLRFFGLTLNPEVIECYTEAKRSAERGFSWDYFRVSALLSLHEQMELKLELRDWLRDRVGLPDQRIAELLA